MQYSQQRAGGVYPPCLCMCVYIFCASIYVCVSVCMLVYMSRWCDEEEKANLSQHALETSRGQRAVQVFSNEDPT